MYNIIQKAHSGLAYLALLVLIIAVVNAFLGMSSKRNFSATDRKISLFALIFCHLQLVIGLLLYFVSPLGLKALSQMSDSAMRLTALEHPLVNILAIVLVTMGWSSHKKQESDNGKFKKIGYLYALGLLLLLSRIPWNLWFN